VQQALSQEEMPSRDDGRTSSPPLPTTGGSLDRMREDLTQKAHNWVANSSTRLDSLDATRKALEWPFPAEGTLTARQGDGDVTSCEADSEEFKLRVERGGSATPLKEVETVFTARYHAEPPVVDSKSSALCSSRPAVTKRWTQNLILCECLDAVRDELARTVSDFYILERFIRLHNPRCEEGASTYYVIMQHSVCGAVVESRGKLERELYELEFYHESRAEAVDKASGVFTEEVRGSRNAEGGKTPGESSWDSAEQKVFQRSAVSQKSLDAFVAAKDAKWYFRILSDFDQIITEISAIAHLLEINFPRVVNPWDRSQDQGPMSMY